MIRNYRMYSAPACIEGNVFNGVSEGVQGAFVFAGLRDLTAYSWNGSTLATSFEYTDGSGRYTLRNLPAGDARVACALRGFVREQKAVDLKAGPCAHVDFRLQAANTISFLVKNWRAYPIPNARVETEFGAWTSEKGVVSIAVPQGHGLFQCIIGAPDYQTKEVTIDPRAPPAGIFWDYADFLRGKVLDEANRPLPGVRVTVDGTSLSSDYAPAAMRIRTNGSTETDSDGMFSLRLPFPPARAVTATKQGYKMERKQFEEDKFQPTWVEIHMNSAQAGIFGRVVDESGNPVQRFMIYGYAREWSSGYKHFEDEDGIFVVPDLPEGGCTICVFSPDRVSSSLHLELKNGSFYGPMVVPLTTPRPVKKSSSIAVLYCGITN